MKSNIKHLFQTICTVCLLFTTASCGDRLPMGVMDEEQMVNFLSEAYLIEGFYAIETNHDYDKLTPEIVNSYHELLERQGISQRQFERSMKYYLRHPELYKPIHQRVVDRLDAQMPEKATPQNDNAGETLL